MKIVAIGLKEAGLPPVLIFETENTTEIEFIFEDGVFRVENVWPQTFRSRFEAFLSVFGSVPFPMSRAEAEALLAIRKLGAQATVDTEFCRR